QYVFEKDWDKTAGKVKRTHPNYRKLNNFLMKRLTEVNDIYFESKDRITPKQIKQKLKGPGGLKSFFALAAERIKDKYERGTFSVAKSELSILYNLEEFLNLKTSKNKSTVIKEIKERRRERISRAKRAEYMWMDGVNYFQKSTALR
ncbi:Arm DNA-binding domain-containing protein, partial [Tamlana crocina]